MGSPQFGQVPTFGAVAFQWARRWSRFWRLVRFFGTPISLLLLLELDSLEGRPARVGGLRPVTAVALVQIGPAHRAETLAIFRAQRRRRQREQHLLAHRPGEVD